MNTIEGWIKSGSAKMRCAKVCLIVFFFTSAGCEHYTDVGGMTTSRIKILRDSAANCDVPLSYTKRFEDCVNSYLIEKSGDAMQHPLTLAEDSWGNLMVFQKAPKCETDHSVCLPYSMGANGLDDCGRKDDLAINCE